MTELMLQDMVPTEMNCLIVGAGMAGLLAAHRLVEAGWKAIVLDKGRGVGGRIATRRISVGNKQAVLDHGAQFFTVRTESFARQVRDWLEAGVVQEWSRGFPEGYEPYRPDGHPRYRGRDGMTSIPKSLAEGLSVCLSTPVAAVYHTKQGWQVQTTNGEFFSANALILTPPVPQSLALLEAGQVDIPEDVSTALHRIEYDPCLAVLAVLEGPSHIPAPGGLRPDHAFITWLADNRQKGISPLPAVTIHTSPAFSREHYSAAQDEATKPAVMQKILSAAAPWLGAQVIAAQLQRWRYSIPGPVYTEPCLVVPGRFPLIFAGDAFAGPRIEGAALSGMAAAAGLINQ